MNRHVIWDWNGTLLDDVDACVGAINRMLRPRRLTPLDRDAYRRIFDFPVIGYYKQLGFDLEKEDWDAVAAEFHDHYGELARHAPLRRGIMETLDSLRSAAIPMSVLSACETTMLRRMLSERGIMHHFEQIRGLDNLHAASKLDAGRSLLADLNLPREALVLVGDTNHDYEVAGAMGIRCLLMAGGHQHETRLRAGEILNTPSELLSSLLDGGGRSTGAGADHGRMMDGL